MSLKVMVAEDQEVVRQGLCALLEREGMQIIAEAADGHEAVRLAEERSPDVAVLALAMPGLNGLDAARGILRHRPKAAVVILTMHKEPHNILEAMRVGIRGYVFKSQAVKELIHAIQEVHRGGIYLGPGVSRVVVEAYVAGGQLPADPLTPRERHVLQLVAEGRTSKQVAALLSLNVKTAESYRSRLMKKLGVHETAGLVRYAIRRGVITATAAWSAVCTDDLMVMLLLGLE